MTAHSTTVGGSIAGRLLACPGSFQATLNLPAVSTPPGEAANLGTAMHAVMDALMRLRQLSGGDISPYVALGDMVGQTFFDRPLTVDHLDTLIYPALYALEALEDAYGGGFRVAEVEKHVTFPGVPNAFGTVDLILHRCVGSQTTALHVDWKFGANPVPAIYKDPAGDLVNPQLMFYLTAAMHSARHIYKGKPDLAVAIIQPLANEVLTHTVVTRKEVKWFAEDLQKAFNTALERNPPRRKGEHCRYAACKINCPLWTGPLLDIAELRPIERTIGEEQTVVTPYAEYLAKAKALVDHFRTYANEIDDQLHAYLEGGGVVPGWKLKQKTKQRQWIDQDEVMAELQSLGFTFAEIAEYKMKSFKTVDAVAKRLGVKVPEHLRVAPPSSETAVVPSTDPAPAPERTLIIDQFRAALAQITHAKSAGSERRQ